MWIWAARRLEQIFTFGPFSSNLHSCQFPPALLTERIFSHSWSRSHQRAVMRNIPYDVLLNQTSVFLLWSSSYNNTIPSASPLRRSDENWLGIRSAIMTFPPHHGNGLISGSVYIKLFSHSNDLRTWSSRFPTLREWACRPASIMSEDICLGKEFSSNHPWVCVYPVLSSALLLPRLFTLMSSV